MKKILIITRSSEFNSRKSPVISKAVRAVQNQPVYHPVKLKAFLKIMNEVDIHRMCGMEDIEAIKQFYSEIQNRYYSDIEEWKDLYFDKPGMTRLKSLRKKDLWNIVASIGGMRGQLLTDLQDFLCDKEAEENKGKWLDMNDVYITFQHELAKENIEVTLVLWDKLQEVVDFVRKEYRLGLIKAICNDCLVDETINGNMLYVHDKQWGVLNKQVELFNQMRDREVDWNDEIITKTELCTLKKYFSYASCFQHIGGEGSLFNNICQLNFGADFVERICSEVERKQVDIFKAKKYLDKQMVYGFKN